MKRPILFPFRTVLVVAFVVVLGCRKDASMEPMKLDQAPGVINQAFAAAKTERKNQAAEVVAALKNSAGNEVVLGQLQTLAAQRDLTPEQRAAVTRALLAVQQALLAAATNGDSRAAQSMQRYGNTR